MGRRRRFPGWRAVIGAVGVMLISGAIASGIWLAGATSDHGEGMPDRSERFVQPPSGVHVVTDETELVVHWNAFDDPAGQLMYEVFRDGEWKDAVSGDQWIDYEAEPGTQHRYRVRTVSYAAGGPWRSAFSPAVEGRVEGRSIADASMAGAWSFDLDLTGGSDDWRRDQDDVGLDWRFLSTCESGPCDLVGSVRLSHVGWQPVRFRQLPWGGGWSGTVRQRNWWCPDGAPESLLFLTFRPTAGMIHDGAWVASEVEGRAGVRFPASSSCTSYLVWDLTGSVETFPDEGPGRS